MPTKRKCSFGSILTSRYIPYVAMFLIVCASVTATLILRKKQKDAEEAEASAALKAEQALRSQMPLEVSQSVSAECFKKCNFELGQCGNDDKCQQNIGEPYEFTDTGLPIIIPKLNNRNYTNLLACQCDLGGCAGVLPEQEFLFCNTVLAYRDGRNASSAYQTGSASSSSPPLTSPDSTASATLSPGT